MNDLINRSALIEAIVNTESEVAKNEPFDAEWFTRMQDRQNEIIELIEHAPAVDAVPVRKGRWIPGECNGIAWMKCSQCLVSQTPTGVFSFCPSCGADMSIW